MTMMIRETCRAFRRMMKDPEMPFSDAARKGDLSDPFATPQCVAGMLIGFISRKSDPLQSALWEDMKRFEREFGTQPLYAFVIAIVREGFEELQKEGK